MNAKTALATTQPAKSKQRRANVRGCDRAEVKRRIGVVGRDPGKFAPHALAHDLDLFDWRPPHRDVADIVVLQMDENAFEIVMFCPRLFFNSTRRTSERIQDTFFAIWNALLLAVSSQNCADQMSGPRLEKLYQRVSRFFGSFLEDPMTGVWQHDNGDIGRDQRHLCGQLIAQ